MAARLITSIFLGRVLGASGLGDVNLINQIITILMVFSMFGMDHVLVKKIAIAKSANNLKAIGSSIYTALKTTSIIALILTLIVLITADFIVDFFNSNQLKLPLIIAAVVLLPQTISVVFAVAINGFHKVWQSRLIKDFTTSLFVLFGLIFAYFSALELNLVNVIVIYAISRVFTFIVSTAYIKKVYSPIFIKSSIDKSMVEMAKPLLFVSATTLLASSIDIIMLGWLSSSENVGLYTVATRLVLFIAFFLQITNAVLSPRIATYFKENKINAIRNLVQNVTSVLFLLGLISVLFFFFLGNSFLSFWGEEFTEAYAILMILSIGQFFNVSTGCSGILLIMSGNEKIFSTLTGIILILNIILNFILINSYGIIGAAIATSFTMVLENCIRVLIAKKRTGVLTIPTMGIRKK